MVPVNFCKCCVWWSHYNGVAAGTTVSCAYALLFTAIRIMFPLCTLSPDSTFYWNVLTAQTFGAAQI